MKNTFYITTAIAYGSAVPHIGNVYEAILADAIARFKRLDGYDVLFQTGTDEHGQKIELKAQINEIEPKVYVDQIAYEIRRIYDMMNVSYDRFIRTTDEDHKESVQAIFKKLYDNGDIYLGKYEGWYSLAEEAFINPTDIVNGLAPNGDKPVWTSEDAYFFKLSKYQDRLIKHIEQNKNFIMPESRKNEMLQNFLKADIPDLCISRTSFKWGIPVSFAKGHVIYVWIDALSNYITGLGYHPDKPLTEQFKKYWPANVHLIGKDILRFHTIYWPIMLMALDLPLPETIFGHPWILFDKLKMSKSTGNVMYTDFLVKHFSVDVIRYYVLHEIPYAQDGNITYELLIERNNSDLANTIGNLVNRTIGMVHKYRDGHLEKVELTKDFEFNLKEEALSALGEMRDLMNVYKVSDALEVVVKLARSANKFIDLTMPWALFKDETKQDELDQVLYTLMETIRFIAVLLQPYMPETAEKIASFIKVSDLSFESLDAFGKLESTDLEKATVLFERYDMDKKIEEITKDINE